MYEFSISDYQHIFYYAKCTITGSGLLLGVAGLLIIS